MVKFTTLLLASVAILAASSSTAHAQISGEPTSVSVKQLEAYTAADLAASSAIEEEANAVILPYPGPEDGSSSLERRATSPTKPKKKKVSAKLSANEQKIILDTHNKFRALHGAGPLTWNQKAADFGNNWIQACRFAHSGGRFGENLAAGYKDFKTSITAWYNEEKFYNYNAPGFSGQTGHFTQVVWKGTKTVGCAVKFCPQSNWNIYICNYDAPGNIVGNNGAYFRQNVLPKRR
ncbi:hypothetical protein EDD11_001248 [Mortierella claussenii]|nr:hypothetical protein EDD11_001248 [Mortierella claussenii]